jgi:predicted anti-sigma-YlaC factor YlaD
MKMDCSQIEVLVQQHLDRELPAVDQQALRDHLNQCQACRATHGPLLDVIRDVEQEAVPQVPVGLLKKVLEELPAMQAGSATQAVIVRPAPKRFVGWFSGIAAAAAIVLVTIMHVRTGMLAPTNGPVSGQSQMVSGDVAPQAVMLLASAACTAPMGAGQSSIALAAGQAAMWHHQQAEAEPVRIMVCMATPPTYQDHPDTLPTSEVLQMISNRAALRGGI